jgi:hypothetical protein
MDSGSKALALILLTTAVREVGTLKTEWLTEQRWLFKMPLISG